MTRNCPPDLGGIAAWLSGYSGISTAIIGGHALKRAVQQRLTSTGIADAEAYVALLESSPEEQQELIELIVVPETWFFRDRNPYAYLRDHVNRHHKGAGPSQPLRLLSAPCSTGEEPYSMAMTLLDMGLPKDGFRIDAIDISHHSIRRARQAVYGKHSFRGVSEAERQLYFQPSAQGLALLPSIRQTVHFRCANLMVALADLARPYDVIFCRNLLIYLEEAASQHLLESLAGLMNDGALLIVGSAETGKVPSALFEAIREPFVFGYRRRDARISPAPLPIGIPAAEPSPVAPGLPASGKPSRHAEVPRRALRSPSAATTRRRRSAKETRERPSLPSAATAAAIPELQLFEQELERNPYSDAAYFQQALWMLNSNRVPEALEALQKCLYLKPDSREALKAMIQITKELGQVERSRQFQGRLARLEP